MSDKTAIEWTDATWNPVTGCTKVSPGCDHCYAETLAERFRGTPSHYFEGGFDLQLRPDKLEQPLRWRRARRVFVNSMSDLFHAGVTDAYIARVWAVMAWSPQHTFQVLTKRPGRMRSLLSSATWLDLVDSEICSVQDWFSGRLFDPEYVEMGNPKYDGPLRNVWLGVSTEDQKWADVRIPVLLDTPAAVRFVSAEPLLGPINFEHLRGISSLSPDWAGGPSGGTGAPHPLIDWMIVGGESGRGARAMDLNWVRSIRDQCVDADVAFLYKQQGSGDGGSKSRRELDGQTWDHFPAVAA